jgi:hypothetical protein
LNILNRHLYRTSTSESEDKPAITIPFSAIRRVVMAHEKHQEFIEISNEIEKRPYDRTDPHIEEVAKRVTRLKKRRTQGP